MAKTYNSIGIFGMLTVGSSYSCTNWERTICERLANKSGYRPYSVPNRYAVHPNANISENLNREIFFNLTHRVWGPPCGGPFFDLWSWV